MVSTSFRVGQRLSNYGAVDVVIERVSVGGFGQVAMGPNRAFGGVWSAIKALRPDILAHSEPETQAQLRANFTREALIWCGLWPHPNVLSAVVATEINAEPMLVLEYAEHGSLRDLLQWEQNRNAHPELNFRVHLHMAQQIAAGLLALHTPDPDMWRDQPIVHRDLKPENILLGQDGCSKITDLGLAKAVQDVEALITANQASGFANRLLSALHLRNAHIPSVRTQTYQTQHGVALGTPAYMAPEQWLDATLADSAADVYAFGLILAELITGQSPILDLDVPYSIEEWGAAHLTQQPRSLRFLRRAGTTNRKDLAELLEVEMMYAQIHADMAQMAHEREQDIDYPPEFDRQQSEAVIMELDSLIRALLARDPEARPTIRQTLTQLQDIGSRLGIRPYTPKEIYPRTPENTRVRWTLWADSYMRLGRYPEALERIERALALEPDNPTTLFSYGRILKELDKPLEALAAFRQADEKTSAGDSQSRSPILGEAGIVLKRLGLYEHAESMYATAIALTPTNATVWYNRSVNAAAWAQAEAGAGHQTAAREHIDKALVYIQQALSLNPLSPRYREFHQELVQARGHLP